MNNIKHTDIPEGEEGDKALKNEIDETMAENLLNLKKEQITRYRKTEGAKQDVPKQTLTKIYYD